MLEDELLQKKHGLTDVVKKKLIDLMKKYKNMDEEGKRKFLFNIRDTLEKQQNKYMSPRSNWMDTFGGYWALIIAVVLLIFVIVFFGYKLYKSLSERERKREEKKKNKQMKKKK